jgi:hypothetical protein
VLETFSVSEQVAALPAGVSKTYARTMDSHGYELGFAAGGEYAPHSHRNLIDLVYAPTGLELPGLTAGRPAAGRLLIVFPGTWFGPVRVGDFFFLKFYEDAGSTEVPDKVTDPHAHRAAFPRERSTLVLDGPASLALPFHRPTGPSTAASGTARIELGPGGLTVDWGPAGSLSIRE